MTLFMWHLLLSKRFSLHEFWFDTWCFRHMSDYKNSDGARFENSHCRVFHATRVISYAWHTVLFFMWQVVLCLSMTPVGHDTCTTVQILMWDMSFMKGVIPHNSRWDTLNFWHLSHCWNFDMNISFYRRASVYKFWCGTCHFGTVSNCINLDVTRVEDDTCLIVQFSCDTCALWHGTHYMKFVVTRVHLDPCCSIFPDPCHTWVPWHTVPLLYGTLRKWVSKWFIEWSLTWGGRIYLALGRLP